VSAHATQVFPCMRTCVHTRAYTHMSLSLIDLSIRAHTHTHKYTDAHTQRHSHTWRHAHSLTHSLTHSLLRKPQCLPPPCVQFCRCDGARAICTPQYGRGCAYLGVNICGYFSHSLRVPTHTHTHTYTHGYRMRVQRNDHESKPKLTTQTRSLHNT
jgi:hypothetical protein